MASPHDGTTPAQPPARNRSGSITFSSSATDPTATADIPATETATVAAATATSSTDPARRRVSLGAINPASQHPAREVDAPVNPATEASPLNPHHRPSIQGDDALGLKGDTTIRRMSNSQNAPGRAGDIGENVIGALGFGGSSVERPKEEQGVAEKIVAFLGA